jgi:hypothetical protein
MNSVFGEDVHASAPEVYILTENPMPAFQCKIKSVRGVRRAHHRHGSRSCVAPSLAASQGLRPHCKTLCLPEREGLRVVA